MVSSRVAHGGYPQPHQARWIKPYLKTRWSKGLRNKVVIKAGEGSRGVGRTVNRYPRGAKRPDLYKIPITLLMAPPRKHMCGVAPDDD